MGECTKYKQNANQSDKSFPFSANLYQVLFECSVLNETEQPGDSYVVLTFLAFYIDDDMTN